MANQHQNITEKLQNVLTCIAQADNLKNYETLPDINQIKGDGFLSEFYTGKVLDKENGKTIDVAVKIAPVDKAMSGSQLFYQNEVHFYSNVFSELDKFQRENGVKRIFDNIPKYLAGSVESEAEFVAMENLTIENYKLIDKKIYFDIEHLELIFNTYGKFHALSFIFKQQNPEKYKSLNKSFNDALGVLVDSPGMQRQIEEGYKAALKTFDPVTEADILVKLKKIEDIKKTISESRHYKGDISCFIHGDCWSNNMLFKYKTSGAVENLKLIDFQLSHENSPIHDLSYFFYAGASKEDMDKLDHYLHVYYKSFCDFAKELNGDMNEIFSLDDFKTEWKKNSHLGLLLGIYVWVSKLTNKDKIMAVISNRNLPREKYSEAWATIKNEVRESEAFKERARNICLHAVEYGIL